MTSVATAVVLASIRMVTPAAASISLSHFPKSTSTVCQSLLQWSAAAEIRLRSVRNLIVVHLIAHKLAFGLPM
jgi:hypothetical protein